MSEENGAPADGVPAAGAPDGDSPGAERSGARRPRGPSRREALRRMRAELEAAGSESPGVEAERLLAHALGIDRVRLARTVDRHLEPEEAGRLARSLSRRLAGEPLQHIEGTVEFRQLTLVADARALIPRPETEELVERIVRWVGDRAPLFRALDIGTGSGAISLSLLAEGIVEAAVALDVSTVALRQAEENRRRTGVPPERLELRTVVGRLWNSVRPGERFDLIVSNPPYVSDAELGKLPPEVGREPLVALAGGEDGVAVIREIVDGAADRLRPRGALFLEIGAAQGAAVRSLLEASGRWGDVIVSRDLAGRDRFVRALPAGEQVAS